MTFIEVNSAGRLRALLTAFLPYDVFVSYGSGDAAAYASRMATRLQARGLRVFLDRNVIPDSAKFESILKRGLRSSSAMLLVASEAAHRSRWVLWEVETYVGAARPIILVTTDSTPRNTELSERLKGLVVYQETPEALAEAQPSKALEARIVETVAFVHRGRRIRLVVLKVAGLVAMLVLVICYQAIVIWRLKGRL